MKQRKQNTKSKQTGLIPKTIFTKSQEGLIKMLEDLKISRGVAQELVRASHPKAIRSWITLMERK
jgi:hypothetical protein